LQLPKTDKRWLGVVFTLAPDFFPGMHEVNPF